MMQIQVSYDEEKNQNCISGRAFFGFQENTHDLDLAPVESRYTMLKSTHFGGSFRVFIM